MIIYILLILFVVGFSFFSVDLRMKKDYHLFWMLVFFIVLSVFAGTRLMGYDYDTYLNHFNGVKNICNYERFDSSIEIGYEYLVSIYKTFSDSFNGFLLFYATVTILLAIIASFKFSPLPLVSFCMFFAYSFIFQVMGQMRQPFAILLLYLLLIPLLCKRRYTLAVVLIFIFAILFHKSCFLALFLFVLKDRILTPKELILILIATCIVYLFSSQIIHLVILILPKSFPLYDVFVAYTSYKSIQITFSLGMVERVAMFFLLYYYSYKSGVYHENYKFRIFLNLYLTGICLYFSFISIAAEFATRGTFFYVYSIFYALPILISLVQDIKIRYFLISVTFAWILYISTTVLRTPEEYIPYKSTLYFSNL